MLFEGDARVGEARNPGPSSPSAEASHDDNERRSIMRASVTSLMANAESICRTRAHVIMVQENGLSREWISPARAKLASM
eukprot:6822219-Alexandrium_andersonii.AAC.1